MKPHPRAKIYWILSTSIAVILFSMLAVSNVGSSQPTSKTIGVILSESGPADYIGKPERAVLDKLWADWRKANPSGGIELLFRDSGTNVAQATVIYESFAANPNVVAIIGPSTSGESIELAKKAERDGVPLLSLAASRDIVFDSTASPEQTRRWTFKFAQNDDLAARRILSRKRAVEIDF